MKIKYIFDIPVYRLTEDEYYSKLNEYVKRELYPGPPESIKKRQEFHKRYPGHKLLHENSLINDYGGSWLYNEIIGFIRLHFVGSQIRGEYYGVASKRITKTRRKQFEFKTWKLAIEIDIPRESDSIIIFSLLCEYLKNCEKMLKKRYIDTSIIKVIGPHVDWLALMNQ